VVLIGPYAGKAGVAHALRRVGLNVGKGDGEVERVYRELVRLYDEGVLREPISEEEFLRILGSLNGDDSK